MVNYQNGKVYKIWSTTGEKIYIGSTTKEYLSQRMDKHRSDYKRWKEGKAEAITSFILFEEYNIEHCFIELLEAKQCNTKDELRQLEGKYIRENICVNKVIPQRTKSEYYDDNKDRMNSISREYYANHKEEREVYLEKTKEHRNEQSREYYHNNKDETNKLRIMKITCECGCVVSKCNMTKHKRTAKHLNFLETPLNQNIEIN